jgi:hypothetical protein
MHEMPAMWRANGDWGVKVDVAEVDELGANVVQEMHMWWFLGTAAPKLLLIVTRSARVSPVVLLF